MTTTQSLVNKCEAGGKNQSNLQLLQNVCVQTEVNTIDISPIINITNTTDNTEVDHDPALHIHDTNGELNNSDAATDDNEILFILMRLRF